jgi:hypothetical protein
LAILFLISSALDIFPPNPFFTFVQVYELS